MAVFEYISARGDVLSFTNGDGYELIQIDKQTSVATDISSATVGGMDGDEVSNVQAQPRSFVFDLCITGNVEQTKRNILKVIKPKQKGKVRWTQESKELAIEGIVESIDMPRWTNKTVMQVTLHCSQPYWENIDYILSEISEAISLHYFTDSPDNMLYFTSEGLALGEYDTTRTREIYNEGDVSIGLEIEIVALATATNPIIYNQDGLFFGCGYGTGSKQLVMSTGDVIKINTSKNQKSITLNGSSILGKIKPQSTWLQLEAGDNTFSINSDDVSIMNLSFSIKYKPRYI